MDPAKQITENLMEDGRAMVAKHIKLLRSQIASPATPASVRTACRRAIRAYRKEWRSIERGYVAITKRFDAEN